MGHSPIPPEIALQFRMHFQVFRHNTILAENVRTHRFKDSTLVATSTNTKSYIHERSSATLVSVLVLEKLNFVKLNTFGESNLTFFF